MSWSLTKENRIYNYFQMLCPDGWQKKIEFIIISKCYVLMADKRKKIKIISKCYVLMADKRKKNL